jgi:uncharacterized protein YbjQ (UPF0145 family)
MLKTKDVFVTTTSSLEGVIIKRYLKPVSSHIVTGTNIFSDLFASFTDVFGGKSQTYQKHIATIYSEAIDAIKKSAHEMGANCVLGLRVDLDEISGKGKSMFMITATGTAAIIEESNKTSLVIAPDEKTDMVSAEKMSELRARKKIIQDAKNKNLNLDESTCNFLVANRVDEIAAEVLEIALQKHFDLFEGKEKFYHQMLSYLNIVPLESRTEILYGCLMNEKFKEFADVLFELIKDLMIFDIEKLRIYLKSDSSAVRRKALQICTVEKEYYTFKDINIYEELAELIQIQFPRLGEITSQKKLLSSKEKEIWICQCGTKNEIQNTHCGTCGKDIYGFFNTEISPEKSISILRETIDIIKSSKISS